MSAVPSAMRGEPSTRGASWPAKPLFAALGYVDEHIDAGRRMTDFLSLEAEQRHDMRGVDRDGRAQ